MARLRQLPPMNALKAFDAAARCRGFTAAAQELSVSAGAISRHVGNLEDYLGVGLFKRYHNDIQLTPAGERYCAQIRSALTVIEDASQHLVDCNNTRELHVSAPPTLALHWLIPRLPRFTAANPGLGIQILTHAVQADHAGMDRIDIALHSSISEPAGNDHDLLFETDLQLVCHPRIAAQINGLADVAQQTLLYTANGSTRWRHWFQSVGLDFASNKCRMIFDNSSLALQAAANGIGIALGESLFVQDDLRTGRLVSPLDARLKTSNRYYMTMNSTRPERLGARKFRDWLLSEMSMSCATLRPTPGPPALSQGGPRRLFQDGHKPRAVDLEHAGVAG